MSNILFFGHKQVSHALDTFFDGCINVFGKPNVYEYPILEKHHGASDYKSFEQHTDIQPVYGWWCRNSIPFVEEFSISEWAQKINNLEIKYVVGSNRAIENFIELLSLIKIESIPHVCIVFIEEDHDLGFELHRNNVESLIPFWNKIDIYYKTDFVKNSICSYDKIKPFYISVRQDKILKEIGEIKSFSEREIDICYLVGASHPNRKMYYDIIKSFKFGTNIIEFGAHKYSLNQYLNIINNSKIFISVRGNELSNTRNIEGPFCGAALFTENINMELPFDYEDGKSAIFYNKNNILNLLTKYISNPKELENLADGSRKHCLNFHTSTKRAEQFLFTAKQLKGW
jgi:hypothetical protein